MDKQEKKIAELEKEIASLNEQLESAFDTISYRQSQAEKLERENARMRSVLEDIVRNAPQGDVQPQSQVEWGFWVAGKLAKKVLAPEVIIPDEPCYYCDGKGEIEAPEILNLDGTTAYKPCPHCNGTGKAQS